MVDYTVRAHYILFIYRIGQRCTVYLCKTMCHKNNQDIAANRRTYIPLRAVWKIDFNVKYAPSLNIVKTKIPYMWARVIYFRVSEINIWQDMWCVICTCGPSLTCQQVIPWTNLRRSNLSGDFLLYVNQNRIQLNFS